MFKKISISCIPLILAACGSGGSSTEDTTTQDTTTTTASLTGVFIDSAVSGATYTIGSTSKATGDDGSFLYSEGDTVTFSIGEIVLGQTVADSIVTPLNLGTATSNPDHPLNIARLLITLDSDGDASNGLQIDTATTTAASVKINFDQSTENFEVDTTVTTLISDATNTTLVTAIEAADHMNTTLTGLTDNTAILSLADTQWESVIISSQCPNVEIGFIYDFTLTGATMVGTDSIDPSTCTPATETTETFAYGDTGDSFLICGPDCDFSGVNKLYSGTDLDGRAHISSVSHATNSGIIKTTKKLTDFDITWTEVFYLKSVSNTPVNVNFVGTTWVETSSYSGCTNTTTVTYTYNQDSFDAVGNELGSDCSEGSVTGNYLYSDLNDLPCLSNGCSLRELNSSYPWEGTTVHWSYLPNGQNYDQGVLVRTKDSYSSIWVKQ